MIVLTHAHDIDGRFEERVEYGGCTMLDPYRIESMEEVKHPAKGAVTYVTMQSGQGHTVTEDVETISKRIAAAVAGRWTVVVGPGVGGDPLGAPSKPEMP